MVRVEDSHPRGFGFESRRILDGCKRFASYCIIEKLEIKVTKWGIPKKYNKKIIIVNKKYLPILKLQKARRFNKFQMKIDFT